MAICAGFEKSVGTRIFFMIAGFIIYSNKTKISE
jgi:hypothetical protein